MGSRRINAAFAGAAALALGLAGCDDKCPTESPKIESVQSCTVRPGAPVTMNVRVCEKCNQSATTCQVDVQGTPPTFQLDPVSEACTDSNGCPPGCSLTPNVGCTFTAPMAEGDYDVIVFNPAGGQVNGILTVSATDPVACAFP
jgi:hypothetical protein